MSTSKTGPRLEPVSASWISTSTDHHVAVDDDVVSLHDNPNRTSPFDHDSGRYGNADGITQEQPQEIFVSEAFLHALTFEVPQTPLESDEIYKIKLKQDYCGLEFLGKIPNFSRPFRSLPSARAKGNTPPESQTMGKEPNFQKSNDIISLVMQESEALLDHPDSEAQSLDHFQKEVSSNPSDTSMTLRGLNENHHQSIQPCGQPLLKTAHPSGPPRILNHCPNGYPNGPSNLTPLVSPENPENPPPPEPPPFGQRPPSSAPRTPKHLMDHIHASHNKTSSRNSNNSSTRSKLQTTDMIQKAEKGRISSWSGTFKQVLNYLPRRQKTESNHEDTPQVGHVGTNRDNRRSPTNIFQTGRAAHGESQSITSDVFTRETERSTPKPPTSVLSNASSSIEKPRLPLKVATTPLTTLKEFHCTFCLIQCEDKGDWLRHEKNFHLEVLENFSQPCTGKEARPDETNSLGSRLSRGKDSRWLLTKSQPQSSSSSRRRQPSAQSAGVSVYSNQHSGRSGAANIFWNCGFCNELLRSWEDRQIHLAEHFSNGKTMRLWDPMKSPFPWRKGSAMPADSPPYWDLQSLLTLQRPTLQDSINQIGTSADQRGTAAKPCKLCHVLHPSLEHYDLWHQPRDTYTCPRITDFTNLADFFDEGEGEHDELVVDWCNACDERFDRPHYLDRDVRMQHLWDFHAFGDCAGWHSCLDEGQFVLHLANTHAVNIEFIRKLVHRCRGIGDTPALMAMGSDS
ncbi:conserved hypothetical protein [Histoplasma capsulatum var. duboisii H88]|uniref:C2H2 type domain containing protein n=1 Tax=Ajellomyces capsulatus (strain H88) TaxID=544711 RepID=F0UBN0_AJEC8|nr:conserved hypothetical protein [Histoplasma capsulatum var. duboisii H88]QSS49270.1 C2H2 type domain containing protein [Histoplasma capsulatum var. duboisii H88]